MPLRTVLVWPVGVRTVQILIDTQKQVSGLAVFRLSFSLVTLCSCLLSKAASVALVKPPWQSASIEHLNGMKIFRDGVTDVVILPNPATLRAWCHLCARPRAGALVPCVDVGLPALRPSLPLGV